MTRYYAEEPCPECGRTKPHSWPVWPSGRPAGPPDEMVTVSCPGGERRELTDIETVEAVSQWDGVGYQCNVPVSGPGRYLVIPLEDPADG